MNKKLKGLFISLVVLTMSFSISMPLNNVSAEENTKDEEFVAGDTLKDDEVVTTMDENGNVYLLDDVEENMPKSNNSKKVQSRSIERITNSSTAVVNFRIYSSASTNTSYYEDGTNREGYTNGYYAADGAFLGYDNETNPTKVKFMQAGVIGWVDVNKVEVLNYTDSKVNTLSKYYVKNGKLYHGISTNLSNSSYSSSLNAGTAPSYLKEGYDYYSYDGHYFYEGSTAASYAKMLNDYRNNRRTNAVNSSSPYYNYYQYLSHRSITTYSADELNKAISALVGASENSYGRTSKLRNLGECFISNQNKYGTNALLMLAVAANESAWGCSNIAAQKNNLFGHAAYDSDPNGSANGYSSVEYSVYYHSAMFISKGYLDPVTDSRYYGANLGDKASGLNVKYASDPYWGEKGAAICWRIDEYLGSKDASKYTIAIKDTLNNNHSVINIKSDANSGSKPLYSTYPVSSKSTYSSYAPSNYPFIVLKNGDKNNYYKIQSDGAVNSDRTGIIQDPSQSEYDFDKDYGYIPKSSVTIVCTGSDSSSSKANTENTTGQPTGKGDSEPTLYYSANSQSVGWLDEVNEPNTAGTTGRSLDLYQIKINLKNAVKSAVLSGQVYSNGSWLNYDKITSSTVIGNANSALQLVNFNLTNQAGYKLQYRVHSADIGWQAWTDQGNNAGTVGKNIQAIDFRLVKDSSIVYSPSIYYQAHVSEKGWLDYVGDSETAGTIGESLSLEAFKIGIDNLDNYQLTIKTYDKVNGWVTRNNVNDETINGTEGESLPLQAINAVLTDNNSGYILQYRTYLSNLGWTEWTNQGENSGDTSGNRQIEAVMFRLVQSNEPVSVSLNKTSLNLYVSSSENLIATITPENVTNKTLTWTTSNSSVATVSSTGKITAKSAGTATI
ncbi:glucosaminidase domain-containing protein, partial [Thomasclavelia saccharogumia]|uniref:glucosaminidase domain-containing protein n=1 Tax=Thomasclavelia saccharogumia TaxID=341225 RepID=UPI00068C7FEB